MKKQTFYAVATTVFEDGRAIVRFAGTQVDWVKPESKFHSTPQADRYIDWFESQTEAQQFINENTL